MGIPGFSRWLIEKKYPSIVEHRSTETKNVPGTNFDNLYLDMNDIIHTCARSDKPASPKNEDEIIKSILKHIDNIFFMICPRQLLYIAIDGVAPRAKMHHQRSKLFLDAQENTLQVGCFNKNSIKPGTKFMSKLFDCLRYYIYNRMNTQNKWKSIKVILSDANVPGEGEHKIMNYIRAQRNQSPNISHVIVGADSDLILLGLTTHLDSFKIMCKDPMSHEFIFINLQELRKQLKNDLVMSQSLPFAWNPERAIDDWIFICFLGGNDFFQNLLSIQFYENVMDTLIDIYKKVVIECKDYLTQDAKPNMKFLKVFLTRFGAMESGIFKKRHEDNQTQMKKKKNRK